MSTHQIHVFISHAWKYSQDYKTLAGWIFGENWSVGQASLDFRDYSVPKDDPIHNAPTSKALREAIYAKIARSHVIVIPSGMYVNFSNWIQKEIDGAAGYEKPILAVIPRGQQRTPDVVTQAAGKEVGWTRDSVIGGIWNLYYRGA